MTYVHISSPPEVESACYRVDSIDAIAAPEGCVGTWQRYVISQGDNKIVGMRCGLRDEVSLILEDYVQRMNVRAGRQRPKPAR
jgi:hypothetical protein